MMLSAADFAELFPPVRKKAPELRPAPKTACMARWDDDGGPTVDLPAFWQASEAFSPPRASTGYGMPDPWTVAVSATIMPTIATYGAAWAVMVAAGHLLRS